MPGLSIFKELGAATTVVLGKVRVVDSGGTEITETTHHSAKVLDQFGGNVYSKTMTMTDNNATRFEEAAKKLRDLVIIVETYDMLMGEATAVVYPVGANNTLGFSKMDISTLWFKNATADDHAKITIMGVEE